MPGLGVICAGKNADEVRIVKDITLQTFAVKAKVAAVGEYEGLSDEHLFDMEYFSLQHKKIKKTNDIPLQRHVALVTGAAGAIGAGICEGLLSAGCHVAVSDLPGDNLASLVNDLKTNYGDRVQAVPIDVTKTDSVAEGFGKIFSTWGGIDLIVVNAGIAHVAPLAEMVPADFRKLEEVNIEGTLNILSAAARHYKSQGTGGDIILVSTKNVFAPGATFGAYSATKAAAHQLARIASLELAGIGVRVNMVSPDAVFSHGVRRSGLWAKVGPDRMRARGLDEKGLEEYYQNRNMLKARITAKHVANAVLYFATRQTPTTGATIPVDGGLPDATPR
jgi:NAD(P)-dependent dehydrogenase (short-subunit alcohol dehydrogenase family)